MGNGYWHEYKGGLQLDFDGNLCDTEFCSAQLPFSALYRQPLTGVMIRLYFTSVSSNLELQKQQQKILMVLDSKKIPYEQIDIANSEEAKNKMRQSMGDPKALPPQLFNGDSYCGGFEAFDSALEEETLNQFLKL